MLPAFLGSHSAVRFDVVKAVYNRVELIKEGGGHDGYREATLYEQA